MIDRRAIIVFAFTAVFAGQVAAFEITGVKWPGAKTQFYISLPGIAASGKSFNSAFLTAVDEWNSKTPFSFSVIPQNLNPCLDDGRNGINFTANNCGTAFGASTLAVTIRRFQIDVLGPGSIAQADIVINNNIEFNVFDGNLVQLGISGLDLTRIAIHEMGHALGLEHSTVSQSIMAPTIGNLYRLTADDIAGATALYSGLSNCNIKSYHFGVINDALDAADCTVSELSAGGGDTSHIDLYRFDVGSTTTFDFTMTSPTLDSVLLVADTDLQIIAHDNKSSNKCDSTLNTTLQPGSYFLLANTYDVPVRDDCGNVGNYQITTAVSSSSFLSLGNVDSLSGGPGFGVFSGGITADNGNSFGNSFRSTDNIDIRARIIVDPAHQGQAGFLVVAALFDGAIHLLDGNGQFVPFDASTGALSKAKFTVLSAQENLDIVTDLVPANLGIASIEVNFVVGYGLNSNPNEVYFHSTPLNLTISP